MNLFIKANILLLFSMFFFNENIQSQANPTIYTDNVIPGKVDNVYYFEMKIDENRIKCKYFLPTDNRSVYEQYESWNNNTDVKLVLYTSAAFLKNTQLMYPDGLSIANGVINNPYLIVGRMDGLVVIDIYGNINVYNLQDGISNLKGNNVDNKFLKIRTSNQDLNDFLSWASTTKSSVFQTHLLISKNNILVSNNSDDSKLPKRFLVASRNLSGNPVNIILDMPIGYTLKKAVDKAINILKSRQIRYIDYMVDLWSYGEGSTLRVINKDRKSFQEFNSFRMNEGTANLLVYYYTPNNTKPNGTLNSKAGIINNLSNGNLDVTIAPSPNQKPNKNTITLSSQQSTINQQTSMNPLDIDSLDSAKSNNLQDLIDYSLRLEISLDFKNTLAQASNIQVAIHDVIVNQIGVLQKRIDKNSQKITTTLNAFTGSKILSIYGRKFTIFVADLKKHNIELNLLDPFTNEHFSSFGKVKDYLEAENKEPLMITNGGMFNPSNDPQGMYIDGNNNTFKLDENTTGKGNFYYQPNGVFYIDNKNKPHIDTMMEIKRLDDDGKFKVKIATQSGPMLVINNRINSLFTKGSQNLNIRSGVGILNDTKVIFAITNAPENFYDFAMFYKIVLQCKNALYLDGAISQMYLIDLNPKNLGGNFGPIISVTNK